MEYRTWITEALRLHFEEHLPRIVAGRRLGVPKSTVCGMFVRFRKAGLSWPLPAGMSERELDARLYGSASTVSVVLTENTVMSEVTVKKNVSNGLNASQLSNLLALFRGCGVFPGPLLYH
ncbi:IS66 family insertion sequence element accessory protein TnpB, partial [Escherichia coli]|nr:IS66 family insertion sequence element accessory protein TnpB [Escherichia coli]